MMLDRIVLKKWIPILFVEVIILLLCAKMNTVSDLFYQDIPASDLIIVSDQTGAHYDEERITAFAPEQTEFDEDEIMSCGPYISLKKGSYDVIIDYSTDTDVNRFRMQCGESRYLDSLYAADKDGYLPSCKNQIVSHIRVLKDIEAFDVQTMYHGVGTLTLHGITIQQTNTDVKYKVISMGLLLMIINLLLLARKRIQNLFSEANYKYTVCIIALTVFASLLIWVNGYYGGHDLMFHLLRIEGLKEALLSGQFPAKIDVSHLRGYGYATGTMYPNLFLYVPAILRILGWDSINSYKGFVLGINLLTAVIAFYSFNRIFKDRLIAMGGTILYVLAPYRIMDLYYRAAVGEYCALTGLPLIAYGLYSFIGTKEQDDEKPRWVLLALGYSIVLESHVITTFIVGVFSLVTGILFIKRFLQKTVLVSLLKSIVLTIVLNLWFLVPFMDYYRLPMNKASIGNLDENGITFAQLFQNQVLADFPIHNTTLEQGIAGEIPFALGYGIIVAALCFLLFIREEKKYRKLGLYSLGLGVFSVICSMYSFPWDKIVQSIPVFGNVQFPWRYLEIALICFIICACIGMKKLAHKMNRYVAMFLIAMLAVWSFTALTDAYLQKAPMNTYASLDTFEIGNMGEYLLNGTDTSDLEKRGGKVFASSEMVSYDGYTKEGTNLEIHVSSESDSEQYVELPLLMYPGYQALAADTKQKLAVTYGDNNVVRVMIPAGFEGIVKVTFAGKWYWTVAEILSVLTLCGLVLIPILRKRQGR